MQQFEDDLMESLTERFLGKKLRRATIFIPSLVVDTSGRVDTNGKFAPTYGRFEIRAKLPGGKGLRPAHWLYPQNRNWELEYLKARAVASGHENLIPEERPWYSEIDIMEFLGHEPNVVDGTLHYYTFDGKKKPAQEPGKITSTIQRTSVFLCWNGSPIRSAGSSEIS